MSKNERDGMSKREWFRERRRRASLRNRIISIGLIILGAVLVALFLVWPNLKPVDVVTVTPRSRPAANFNQVGNANAPVKLDEYSDYQCPYCAKFSETTEQALLDAYVATGKVLFTYHSVGEFIGPESARSAEAAYCAGDQNKYWEYHDILFANQTGENVGAFADRRLKAFAESLSLNMDTFNSCFDSGKFADRVEQDYKDGSAAGITGTPAFFLTYTVDGETKHKLIAGAYPFSEFQTQIDGALADMGQ